MTKGIGGFPAFLPIRQDDSTDDGVFILYNRLIYSAILKSQDVDLSKLHLKTPPIALSAIASKMDCSIDTVRRKLRRLQEVGVVEQVTRNGKKARYKVFVDTNTMIVLGSLSKAVLQSAREWYEGITPTFGDITTPRKSARGLLGVSDVTVGGNGGKVVRSEKKVSTNNSLNEGGVGETIKPGGNTRAEALVWYRHYVHLMFGVKPTFNPEKLDWLTSKKMDAEDFTQFYAVMSTMLKTWDVWKKTIKGNKISAVYPPIEWYVPWLNNWLAWHRERSTKGRSQHSGNKDSFL